MEQLHIDLKDHSYDILIGGGLLQEAGALICRLRPKARAVVLTDDTVLRLYGDSLSQSLAEAGISAAFFSIPSGESSKSMDQLEKLLNFMAAHRLTRSDLLIAFGGGVVGDLGGFAAASYMRGIDFIQIPTTLLAQVDSSVGGKTAVNLDSGKNLAGAFWQPRLVIADTSVLSTLSRREFAGGMAEVIKYGCIFDRDFFAFLESCLDSSALMAHMPYIIRTCCDLKRIVVEEDERDTGHRMMLNFGHTFGHAIETIGSYQRYIHGEAVALGMILAVAYGSLAGVTPGDFADPLARLCRRFGLPVTCDIRPTELIKHMTIDKKADGTTLRLILLSQPGRAFIQTVTLEELTTAMKQLDHIWGN